MGQSSESMFPHVCQLMLGVQLVVLVWVPRGKQAGIETLYAWNTKRTAAVLGVHAETGGCQAMARLMAPRTAPF